MSKPVSTAILSSAILLVALSVVQPPAQAQWYGPVGIAQDGTGPLYVNPVFEGDARGSDIYYYLHPYDPGPWNQYQMLVQQIEAQDNAAIPPPTPLPVSRPYPFNPVVSEPYYGGEPGAANTPTSGTTNGQVETTPFNSPPGLVE